MEDRGRDCSFGLTFLDALHEEPVDLVSGLTLQESELQRLVDSIVGVVLAVRSLVAADHAHG